jgi:hypothetical protein
MKMITNKTENRREINFLANMEALPAYGQIK